MTEALLTASPAILTWLAVGYTLPSLRRRRDDGTMRAFALSLLFLALALTVLMPGIYREIDGAAGIANLSRLLGNGLVLVAGWQIQTFLFHLNYPHERVRPWVRWSGALLVTALILMSGFFALTPVHVEAFDFVGRYGTAPFVLAYRLVFLADLGLALSIIAYLSWRYAGLVDRPSLRLGLRIDAVGGLVGLGYIAHEALRVTAARLGLVLPLPDPMVVTQTLEAASVTLMLVGCTMPAWGPHVGIPRLSAWVTRYRAYQRLRPLWWALYRAHPEIALFPPRSTLRDVLDVRDLTFRLYRRVIEIRDGSFALRPYTDALVVEEASARCRQVGLPPDQVGAVTAAVSLAAALQAKRQGRLALRPYAATISPGGNDLGTEAAALERVAWALNHSPIVRTVIESVRTHAQQPAGDG